MICHLATAQTARRQSYFWQRKLSLFCIVFDGAAYRAVKFGIAYRVGHADESMSTRTHTNSEPNHMFASITNATNT